MSQETHDSGQALVKRLEEEVNARKDLQLELVNSLRTQRALQKEIQLLREVLNARSTADFVAYKSMRRARSLVRQGPRKFAKRAIQSARRRAGVTSRKVLALRKHES